MKLLNRIRNLWRLSELQTTKIGIVDGKVVKEYAKWPPVEEKPKLAQIIKRSNPTEAFLKEEPQK